METFFRTIVRLGYYLHFFISCGCTHTSGIPPPLTTPNIFLGCECTIADIVSVRECSVQRV